jgi:hypothetical protein
MRFNGQNIASEKWPLSFVTVDTYCITLQKDEK